MILHQISWNVLSYQLRRRHRKWRYHSEAAGRAEAGTKTRTSGRLVMSHQCCNVGSWRAERRTFVSAPLKVLHRSVQPPALHPLLQLHRLTNNHWDFVLHWFKKIHFDTALAFCLRLFITLPSHLMEMANPHQVQDRHHVKCQKKKKAPISLTHCALQQWKKCWNGEG